MNTKLIAKFKSINSYENKYMNEKELSKDLARYASSKCFVEIRLKTSGDWLRGCSPTLVDRDAFLHFEGAEIDASLYPRLHAWYDKVKAYPEEERNKWGETEDLELAIQ